MGKIVKGIVAVGLIVAGVVTMNPALIAQGISVGMSALKKSKGPVNSNENIDRLRANVDPRTPRKTVVGITAMATDIRDEEFTGDQEYFHRFIVVASHKVNAINEVWFDDKVAWTSAGGAQGEFAGYLDVTTRLEGTAGNAINISTRMGSARRYTGLAYVHLKYKLTGNSKKAESPFASSITTRITIRGEGALIYDPRLDSTVAGGSGAHRADDQATWLWDADSARNPALQLLFYLLDYKIDGKLVVGKGIPADRIDLESFAVAANICDELVATESAGTEPRYRTDGIWSEGDSPTTVMDMLKASMNADLDDVGGKLRLTIFHNDLATPVADFTADDVIGSFEWQKSAPLDQTFNIVRGAYTDASDESLYQQPDYPLQSVASDDDIDRIDTFNLPMVQSADQAQRLASLRLIRQQHSGVFRADFQATAWAVQKNSVVRLTFGPTGFVSKLFRVASMEIRQDGVVPMELREESADIYASPALAAPIAAIAASPFDFSKDPIIQALAVADQSLIASSSQTDFTLTATDTDIVISNHNRRYTDRTVAVTGTTLTIDDASAAIADETRYYLYYDDASRLGGAVAWKATTDFNAAQNDPSNPNRHYAGWITTDAIGGSGTVGGGVLPSGTGYEVYF